MLQKRQARLNFNLFWLFKVRLTKTTAILFVTLSAFSFNKGQDNIVVDRNKVLATTGIVINKTQPIQIPLGKGIGKVGTLPIKEKNLIILRLHFRVLTAPAQPTWALQIKDDNDFVKWELSSNDNRTSFWSDEIRSKKVTVEIYSTVENTPLQIVIDKIAVKEGEFFPQAIVGNNDLEPINKQSPVVKELGKSVSLIEFENENGFQTCTGFLVSPNLILTNYHCVKSENERESTFVYFDYDIDNDQLKKASNYLKEFAIPPNKELEKLDFAIFRLAHNTVNRTPLKLDSKEPANGEGLLIIQHPDGKNKKVSQIDCNVSNPATQGTSLELTDFAHRCDTKGGSSGSGVIDFSTKKVVGLHHLGFRPTVIRPDAVENRAVKMKLIIDYIKNNHTNLAAEIGL